MPITDIDISSGGFGRRRGCSSKVIVFAMILVAVLMSSAIAGLMIQAPHNGEPRLSQTQGDTSAGTLYASRGPISINGNGGFTVANGVVGGSGTVSDPYIISNWDINASTADGIRIVSADAHFIVSSCLVHDGGPGNHVGIVLDHCLNGTLKNNTCSRNLDGIDVLSSSHNTVIGNNCSSNDYGMWLAWGNNNTLSNNSCFSNRIDGIDVGPSCYNTVSYNRFCSSGYDGVYLYSTYRSGPYCHDNVIYHNLIGSNVGYGALVEFAFANRFWQNSFTGNNGATSVYSSSHTQACDNWTNWWNSADGHGNYWGDWTSPDADANGIVDLPYGVSKTADAKDNYPLARPPMIEFTLSLMKGWNFVSIPLVGHGYKASTLGLATGDMISSWNSTTQSYDHSYVKGISPPGADFAMVPNAGYWIWVAAAKTLHLGGNIPTTVQVCSITLPSAGGWAAIGLESLKTTWRASDLMAMYSGTGAITLVAYYQPLGGYHAFVYGIPSDNFLLVPGLAYWIWVTAGPGGAISYMP